MGQSHSQNESKSVNKTLQGRLGAIVGDKHVLGKDKIQLRDCGWCEHSQRANLLVRPSSEEELSAVAKLANEMGVKLVTQGGLTGLVDATTTEPDNVIVSSERLNKIIRVDPLQNVLIAERDSCTLGGIVSTNAGGIRVIRYGMTRENVLGLNAVMADGTIVDASNTLMKNNAGYDLKHLFIGTEGTLGMVTSVVFKLFAKPIREHTALVAAKSSDDLLELLSRCRRDVGSALLSFEGLWEDYYMGKTQAAGIRAPIEEAYPVYGIIEGGVWRAGENANPLEEVLSIALEDELIADAVMASSESERREIWDIRENGEPLSMYGKNLQSFDVGFELNDIAPFVERLKLRMAQSWPEKPVFVFGHIGDGNLHIVLANSDEEHARREEYSKVVYEVTSEFSNSTVSAEHGIGLEKKQYLYHSRSTEQVQVMQRLRAAMDPASMLNAGKIF